MHYLASMRHALIVTILGSTTFTLSFSRQHTAITSTTAHSIFAQTFTAQITQPIQRHKLAHLSFPSSFDLIS